MVCLFINAVACVWVTCMIAISRFRPCPSKQLEDSARVQRMLLANARLAMEPIDPALNQVGHNGGGQKGGKGTVHQSLNVLRDAFCVIMALQVRCYVCWIVFDTPTALCVRPSGSKLLQTFAESEADALRWGALSWVWV